MLVSDVSKYGCNRFVVWAILPGLPTSFHWAALAKAHKQLWKDFVVTILFVVHVAGAFGFLSPLTTTQVMSTLLSKHCRSTFGMNDGSNCRNQAITPTTAPDYANPGQ